MPNLSRESDTLTVVQAFKMMSSPDARVSAIAAGQLKRYTCLRSHIADASTDDMAGYMSGKPPLGVARRRYNDTSSYLWTCLPAASRRLGVSWTFSQLATTS